MSRGGRSQKAGCSLGDGHRMPSSRSCWLRCCCSGCWAGCFCCAGCCFRCRCRDGAFSGAGGEGEAAASAVGCSAGVLDPCGWLPGASYETCKRHSTGLAAGTGMQAVFDVAECSTALHCGTSHAGVHACPTVHIQPCAPHPQARSAPAPAPASGPPPRRAAVPARRPAGMQLPLQRGGGRLRGISASVKIHGSDLNMLLMC